jgi:DNA invertase Pin-like site-specific DNA recombinase
MILGYARVSTNEQNLDLQIDALKAQGCEDIYQEKMSGTKDDRPELAKLLSYARKGDIICVYKLDRLGRSTKKIIELAEELSDRGIELVSIRDKIDTTTPTGKAMFRMLAVLAELERDIIVERTKAGLEAARARGRKGGRPSTKKDKVETALKMYDSGDYEVMEICETVGISKPTLYRYINQRKEELKN